MFNFRRVLHNSVSTVCRQLAASLNGNGTSLFGRGRIPIQRSLQSSAVRLQEAEEASETKSEEKSSQDFSYYPPMPGEDSPLRWDGMKYEELPIVHIKATYNNTHVQLTNSAGKPMVLTTCGIEGFKNIKKSKPIASHTAGISVASKALVKGVKFVRVVVKGLGPGRQAAINGLTMGGLEVVSITDNTPVPHNGCRPRKAIR